MARLHLTAIVTQRGCELRRLMLVLSLLPVPESSQFPHSSPGLQNPVRHTTRLQPLWTDLSAGLGQVVRINLPRILIFGHNVMLQRRVMALKKVTRKRLVKVGPPIVCVAIDLVQ